MKRQSSNSSAAALVGLVLAGLSAPTALGETRTYVMSWFVPAMYAHEGDCTNLEPHIEPGSSAVESLFARVLMRNGLSREEIVRLREGAQKNYGLGSEFFNQITNRGRIDGRPVNAYQNPESVEDPQITTVTGKYAIGFNLDGKGAGESGAFQDPYTHEKGVDNQLYRATGCLRSSRVVAPERSSHFEDVWFHNAEKTAAWLISITGEDLSKEGDVTVTFDKAVERFRLDALGKVRRDVTFRVDPNPSTHSVLRGRVKDGVVTVEAGRFYMGGKFITTPVDLSSAQLRLQLKPDGSLDGLLGGYQVWKHIYYSFFGLIALNTEANFAIDVPGMYHVLKRLADADPDPATGQNRRLSVAYVIQAVPAFTVPARGRDAPILAVSSKPMTPPIASKDFTASKEPVSSGGAPVTRRLTPIQYRRIISDVFGEGIDVTGRFEPDVRDGPVGGLTSVGTGRVSVSAMGYEQYDGTARAIAAKVVDPTNRDLLFPCKPAAADAPDNACARAFLSAAGRFLYRRPLTVEELDVSVALAEHAAKTVDDFYAGIELSLASMLQSLPFLFRDEILEPDPAHPGRYRLDAFSKASRLSFLLWNAGPDKELLEAAESGEIHTQEGLARQANRLLASPRLEDGVRAFFTDMLDLEKLATISKDSTIYPKYTSEVARDALEQTLRTITDHLLMQQGDYRDLFTTRKTFLTPLLGSVYGVPVATDGMMDELDIWQPYVYPEGDPRVGILTQASFVSLHSHPGRTSPTLRGKALRELLFCEKVPDPPANVDFSKFEQADGVYKTTRERLSAHSNQPMCAGCHKITDPMGLALDNFDGAAGYRAAENGALIDASGKFNGKAFTNAAELANAVHDYPGVASCLVDKLYAYGVGRTPEKGEGPWMAYLKEGFVKSGHRVPDLLRRIVTSKAFYRVTATPAEPATLASERRQ